MDPLWSETCLSTFKYFIILIVSTYYILCISWIIKCLIIIDGQYKHEDQIGIINYTGLCIGLFLKEMNFILYGGKWIFTYNPGLLSWKCKHLNPYTRLRLRHSTQDRPVISFERAPNSKTSATCSLITYYDKLMSPSDGLKPGRTKWSPFPKWHIWTNLKFGFCQEHRIYLESIQLRMQELNSYASCPLSVPNNEMTSIPVYTLWPTIFLIAKRVLRKNYRRRGG